MPKRFLRSRLLDRGAERAERILCGRQVHVCQVIKVHNSLINFWILGMYHSAGKYHHLDVPVRGDQLLEHESANEPRCPSKPGSATFAFLQTVSPCRKCSPFGTSGVFVRNRPISWPPCVGLLLLTFLPHRACGEGP